MVFDSQSSSNIKGLSLIELLISLFLLFFLFSFGAFSTINILRDYQIIQETEKLITNLKFLQLFSLYQRKDSCYGIKFQNDKYSVFQKVGEEREFLKVYILPSGFKIEGPEEIVFEKDSGKPSFEGIIRISEVNSQGVVLKKKEIEINSEGNIEILK